MKFKDVQTLQSLVKRLNEYGMSTGGASYGANKPSPSTAQSSSPTTTPSLADLSKPIKPVPAKGLENGTEFKDENGEVAGKVHSMIGSTPNPDQVVVELPDGKYELYDPEVEVMVDEDISHDALKKIKNDDQSKSNSANKRIKRLARKNQLREQSTEQLFEINFNQKHTVTRALDAYIKCGFEAETSWEGYNGSSSDDIDDLDWSEIEERVDNEYGERYTERMTEGYHEWLREDKIYEYEGELIQELVAERKEDENYIEQFIDSNGGPTSEAVDRYKEDFKNQNPAEYKSRIEDGYEYMNWLREVVEEEYEDELIEYLEQEARDSGEVMDEAFDQALQNHTMYDWIHDHYGSPSSMLSDFDVFLASDGGLEEIGDEVSNWAYNNSKYNDVETGEYHSGGINNSYWRVEDDSSIESDGLGAEIISPVYNSPRDMLEEMKSLFELLADRNVDTNRSTGLHVTMSWNGEQNGISGFAEVNRVKLAVLLGDKYLLSTFGRENNSYAKSQYQRLQKKASELKADPSNIKTIKDIEDILITGISQDKFTSINFKDQQDSESGHNLVEFRIGGGNDYHQDFPTVVKSVVRYAETLNAAYSDELHNADYIKALFKLINNVGTIGKDIEDRVKDRFTYEDPLIDVLKGFFSKENYIDSIENINAAFKFLDGYNEHHEKEDLETAQINYVKALQQAGYDLNQNLNREPVNAKAIGVLRKSLPQFKLSYDSLSTTINKTFGNVRGIGYSQNDQVNHTQETTFERVKNGIDRLFKKTVVNDPSWLTHPQVNEILVGIWNGFNTTILWKDSEAVDLIASASNQTSNSVAELFKTMSGDSGMGNSGIPWGQFGRRLRNELQWPLPGGPIQDEALDKLTKKLTTYDKWEHPVSKKFDSRRERESYADHATSSLTDNLRTRILALNKLNGTNPELYINSVKLLANSTEQLLKTVGDKQANSYGDRLEDLFPELKDTEYGQTRPELYFIITKDDMQRTKSNIEALRGTNYIPGPFDDNPVDQISASVVRYINDSLSAYYNRLGQDKDFYNKSKAIQKIIKPRTDAIATWMTNLDKISQQMGFNSQKDDIDNKLTQHKRGEEFTSKYIGDAPATITTYAYGGDLYVTEQLLGDMAQMTGKINRDEPITDEESRAFYSQFFFDSSMYASESQKVFNVPWAYYYIALEASKIFSAESDRTSRAIALRRDERQWRNKSADKILNKWNMIYGYEFDNFNNDGFRKIKKVNKDAFRKLGIEVIENGDGREGVEPYNLEPLLPRSVINGPGGEPFEPTSANVWRMNNPDIVKKLSKEDSTFFPDDEDLIQNIRTKFPSFDSMMRDGISRYFEGPTMMLVKFLNMTNTKGVDQNVLLSALLAGLTRDGPYTLAKAIEVVKNGNTYNTTTHSVDAPGVEQGEPLRGRVQERPPFGIESTTFEKLEAKTLEEQLLMLEKIDSSKINNIHIKMFERDLGRAELKTPARIQAFADKLSAGAEFDLAGFTGKIVLDPEMADAFYNAENASQLPSKLRTADGEIIAYSALEKTADFGARTADADGDAPVKVSNKGEVAEGILGCGTFARLLVRPSAPVTSLDIENVIKRLPKDAPDKGGWHELTLTAQEVDNPIADYFTLTLNLKHDTYMDFIDPKKWGVMQQITTGVAEYVNDNLERYTNYFQANGKVDTVKVIADGVTGETDTKVDVFLTHSLDGGPEKTLQHFDMSVKVGSTKQMGQVGGGKQKEPLTVRYSILKEMWDRFNVDLTPIEDQFITADSVEQGYRIAYTEATKQLSSQLTSEENEKNFLVKLLDAIKFFATLNDDRVKLVQFTDLKAGGYYVLDFKKLDRMMDKDKVDLEARMIETAKHPKITIFNKITGKEFLSVRMYQNSKGYIRNYIEKEKGLVDLLKVRGSSMRKKVESVQEGAVPNNDTIRKLRLVLASPILTGDLKAQMTAYVCIPDPSMIRDFRAARAAYGDKHDIRSIVKGYAKMKLNKNVLKQL